MDESRCPDPLAPYGVSKLACEHYLRVFAREAGLSYVSLRYGNVYGPRQDPHGEAGVVAIFTTRMLARAAGDVTVPEPVINGDGYYVRDYVYVDDVVRANLLAARYPDSGSFHVATGVGTDVNQLWELLAELTGYRGPARHGPPRAGDVRRIVLDPRQAGRELGWAPEIALAEGLSRTVAWFRRRLGLDIQR